MMTKAQPTSCKNSTRKRSSKHAMLSLKRTKSSHSQQRRSTENPNVVSPNMDFEDDRSNDDDTKIPVQGRVGENDTTTPVVQNQHEVEENPAEDEIVAHRNDMDYPTLST